MQSQNLVILGSTGSVGQSTLAVIANNPRQYQAWALVGNTNVNKMFEQCLQFRPRFVAMADKEAAFILQEKLRKISLNFGASIEVLAGIDDICSLASHSDADQVMAAIVGVAGLLPTLAAIKAGKRVLLANKESLVTCGQLFLDEVKKNNAELLPVDSEHNAIFQCLPIKAQRQIGFCSLAELGITKIVLTGSGGAFLKTDLSEFECITPTQAIAHPNWSMGRKISVDSATMMNKGLEYIEARWLFNANAEQIEVVIHPQSIIHSMVRYQDGSVIAQMGKPDMCTPIAQAMAYPTRINAGVEALDFYQLNGLTFVKPDFQRYPCLQLAIEASQAGQYATTAMNAANEIAVKAFLAGRVKFTDIAKINRKTVELIQTVAIKSIEDVLAIDKEARQIAKTFISTF